MNLQHPEFPVVIKRAQELQNGLGLSTCRALELATLEARVFFFEELLKHLEAYGDEKEKKYYLKKLLKVKKKMKRISR